MPKQTGGEKCYGPYQHGSRWRVVIVHADGTRHHASERDDGPEGFATREAAQAFVEGFRRAAEQRTIGETVTDHVADLDCKPVSRETARHKLRGLFGPTRDQLLSTLRPQLAKAIIERRQSEVASETVIGELKYAARFAEWCVQRGYIAVNPFGDVELKRGERTRGKPQLRVDEARRFLAFAERDQSPEMTAVLMALTMGLRAHEIVERTVRDLDDCGRALVIGKSKSKAGERTVGVPPIVRDRLLKLVAGRQPTDRIFPDCTRHWLYHHTARLIAAAGLPRVTPHGLRGTFASIALVAGLPGYDRSPRVTVREVSATMGHASTAVTREHYIAPGSAETADVAAVERMLDAGNGSMGSRYQLPDMEDDDVVN